MIGWFPFLRRRGVLFSGGSWEIECHFQLLALSPRGEFTAAGACLSDCGRVSGGRSGRGHQ